MNIGGLGARAALSKHQKPTKPCERCGLRYADDLDVCSHCGDLSDRELLSFKDKLEMERKNSSQIGTYFIVISIVSALAFLSFLD